MTTFTQQDKVPMAIRPGASFHRTIIIKDNAGAVKNLTGFSYFCQVRTEPGGPLLASMMIVVTAAAGMVEFSLTLDQTKVIGETGGVYDIIEQQDSNPQGATNWLFGGNIELLPTVTEV
jgi:hypothetical protein